MFNCADDVLAYHDDDVTLPTPQQTAMRGHRNANRDRLKKGLKDQGKPSVREFRSQGSYAMKTMVQHPDNDYDIDDGVYFDKEVLVGVRGAEMTALQARQMVRDAVDDDSFKDPPEVRKNCVRVYYATGYHVDLPVYRRVTTKDVFGNETYHHELASVDWKRSDARDVTTWFDGENDRQSPDADNGRQLRRVTREIKKYARSRASWGPQALSGFGITKLVTECFHGDSKREDKALYDTMKAIRDRLNFDLVVRHPVTPGDTITNGNDDPKARFLRDRLSDAVANLAPLFQNDCTRKKALGCWDKVYDTEFFSNRLELVEESAKSSLAAPAVFSSGLLTKSALDSAAQSAVRKEGGGRYA